MNYLFLLKNRKFFSFFLTQFLGAFNDNFLRAAFMVWIVFDERMAKASFSYLYPNLALILFILPFFLFSPLAGQLADKYAKTTLIRLIKLSEIFIATLVLYGFSQETPAILFFSLFLMGTHSAFFGAIKYSILPDLLEPQNLVVGNAFIELSTFIAILLSTVGGTYLLTYLGTTGISVFILGIAILGLLSSLFIPSLIPAFPTYTLEWRFFTQLHRMMNYIRQDSSIFYAIILLAWTWMIGSFLLTHLPSFIKTVFDGTEMIVIWSYLLFSAGIGIGSFAVQPLTKGTVRLVFLPFLFLLMVPFLLDIGLLKPLSFSSFEFLSFLFHSHGIRFSVEIFSLAALGGFTMVLLFTYIQTHTPSFWRAQVIAASNMFNATFIVFSSGLSFILLYGGLSFPNLFFILAIGQLMMCLSFIFMRDNK